LPPEHVTHLPAKTLLVMTLSRAIAYCQHYDSFASGKTIAQQVLDQLGQGPDVLMLFVTIRHDLAQLLDGIRTVLPQTPIVGCSGLGMITTIGSDHANYAAALLGMASATIQFHPFLVADESYPAGLEIGQMVARTATNIADQRLLFMFHEPCSYNGVELFEGLKMAFPKTLDVVGGAAGHDYVAEQTYQFLDRPGDRQISTNAVNGLLLVGDFRYQIGVSHGSQPMGEFRQVTQSMGTTVMEVDQQPVLEFLKNVIGEDRIYDFEQLTNTICFGLPFEQQNYCENLLLRGVTGYDQQQGTIQTTSPIPAGSQFQITRRNPERVLSATRQMAEQLIDRLDRPKETLYFYFNCDGRGSYLFGEPETDVEALQSVIGEQVDLFGLFCFSETAPVAQENTFHAYTGVLVALESC
jgi:hypothetical protein